MGMDPRMLRAEDVPVLNELDSPEKQIRVLYEFMYQLHEQLRYILSNLSEDNWNETALRELLSQMAAATGEEGAHETAGNGIQ